MRIILIVQGFLSLSGAAEVVDNLAVQFQKHDHAVRILTSAEKSRQPDESIRKPISESNVTSVELRGRKPVTWRHLERLVREPMASRRNQLVGIFRDWRPDVVNSHVSSWDIYPTIRAACGIAGVPWVQSFHDSGDRGRGKFGTRALTALRGTRAITAVSAATREFFSRLEPGLAKASIITGGVDCSAAAAAHAHVRSRPYIFCAARLDLKFKALDTLLTAFSSIRNAIPDVDLLIAGDGPDKARLQTMVGDLQLNARVEFVGSLSRDQLRPLYKGAQCFVMPSRREEGVPLVFLDAMAAGTPVIGTRTGGVPELIRITENGLLVDEDDAEQLAAAISRQVESPDKGRAMATRALADVAKYDWSRFAEKYLEIYSAALRERTPVTA